MGAAEDRPRKRNITRFRRHLSPKPDLFTKQPHGHCLDWEKPGRSAQPVAASRRNPFDSSSARLENRASWRTSRCNKNAPHGIGKPTANCDLMPLATANGYRPADGWGVVNQAWRPGKTGDSKQGRHHAKTRKHCHFCTRSIVPCVRDVGYLAGVFVVVDVGDVVKLKCWCRSRNQSSGKELGRQSEPLNLNCVSISVSRLSTRR